jgi:large subunit ribosomal protein L10
LAFTRKHKEDVLKDYTEWLSKSNSFFVMSYGNMTMKTIDDLRAKVRNEADGHVHVVKNTLFKKALEQAGISYDDGFTGRSIIGFANSDAPAMAKLLNEATKNKMFEFKVGYFDGKALSVNDIKALAELPPLPVMRATLLGTIAAPASKLVRTLAEPARSMAAVVKAYSESNAPAGA